jgi:hypothetical protein
LREKYCWLMADKLIEHGSSHARMQFKGKMTTETQQNSSLDQEGTCHIANGQAPTDLWSCTN